MKKHALVEHIVSIAVFVILIIYNYGLLAIDPYMGFLVPSLDGVVVRLFATSANSDQVQIGDKVERVGDVTWENFQTDLSQPLIENIAVGDTVELELIRDGRREIIHWVIPERTNSEFIERLSNIWWLAYVFWFAGMLTVLVIRPLDLRQILLVTFFYLTALWLMTGAAGNNHLWHSTVISRALLLLTVPVYLHLHWIFPKPLWKLRTVFWLPLYLIGFTLAIAQFLQLLPPSAFVLGALIAICGSIMLVALHLILKREQRRDIVIMLVLIVFAFFPILIISIIKLNETLPAVLLLGLLTLAGLPSAYFYIAYRQQSGWLEIRANRLIALYLFAILMFAFTTLVIFLIFRGDLEKNSMPVFLPIFTGVIFFTILGFPYFQKFVDKHLLGMPMDRDRLVESFAARITANLDRQNLTKLLREELLPTLQIRQSAIILPISDEQPEIFYEDGIAIEQIPNRFELEKIAENNNLPSPVSSMEPTWIRLVILLQLDGKLGGVWLFGRHDPDDIYSHEDIKLLELLGNQTAIAMANIKQTELLQNLYASNIQRQEKERNNLARNLHDVVLNDLSQLNLQHFNNSDGFTATYEELTNYVRLIIHGLRPAMLDYGLWRTFDGLLDDVQDRVITNVSLQLDIPRSDIRYDPEIEQHLFRIVQQAVENALEHAQATAIRIQGHLQKDDVFLMVEDNGRGLPDDQHLDLRALLKSKHYGLVSMYERAALIRAQLDITSEPDKFTRIRLVWPKYDGFGGPTIFL